MIINIHSKGKFPANALSNFAAHSFDFDGYKQIPSMESFLQSLKFETPFDQETVLYLSARDAKRVGSQKEWDKILFWKGKPIDRRSKEYRAFLMQVYRQLLQNSDFREALKASKGHILLHTIGKTRRRSTVLTWWEFLYILNTLKKEI